MLVPVFDHIDGSIKIGKKLSRYKVRDPNLHGSEDEYGFGILDSDIEFIKSIPEDWFDLCLPSDTFLTLHERINFYTETGFLAFNNKLLNQKGESISNEFFNLYKNTDEHFMFLRIKMSLYRSK